MDIEELAVRAAISDALHLYSRGIDRCDPEAVRAAFHPDGILIDYGSPDPVPIGAFADRACASLRDRYLATQHRVTNTLVARDGDTAVAESYILAFHVEATPDGKVLHTFNGRWIDTFEQRDAQWRIAQRVLRIDWSRSDPWADDMAGNYVPSARDRSDVIYA